MGSRVAGFLTALALTACASPLISDGTVPEKPDEQTTGCIGTLLVDGQREVMLTQGCVAFVVGGDFDGNGVDDLAVGEVACDFPLIGPLDGRVGLLLAEGGGHFRANGGAELGHDRLPVGAVAGDFDEDGQLDLVVFGSIHTGAEEPPAGAWVRPFFGRGDGSLAAGNEVLLEMFERLEAGDVDGDGHLDLIIERRHADGSVLALLAGDGTGRLALSNSFSFREASSSRAPWEWLLTSTDGDTTADLLVGEGDGTYLWRGTGGGSFERVPIALGPGRPGRVADFDGDGRQDLVLIDAGLSGDVLYLLPGASGGGFAADSVEHRRAAGHVERVGLLDFDGDGIGDLYATLFGADVRLQIWRAEGPGTFSQDGSVSILPAASPYDIALGTFISATVSGLVHWGRDWVAFPSAGEDAGLLPGFAAAGSLPLSLTTADLDGDGLRDLIVAGDRTIATLFGAAAGVLSPPQIARAPEQLLAVASAAFDADRRDEIVGIVVGRDGDGLLVARDTELLVQKALGERGTTGAATGDFDGDGNDELVIVGLDWSLLLRRDVGGWVPYARFPVGGSSVTIGDFDGDGNLDIALLGTKLQLVLGTGDGTFAEVETLRVPGGMHSAFAADSDGRSGLVIAGRGRLDIVRRANGVWQHQRLESSVDRPADLAADDLDGDGRADVVLLDSFGRIVVRRGLRDGSLGPERSYPAGGRAAGLVLERLGVAGQLYIAVARESGTIGLQAVTCGGD